MTIDINTNEYKITIPGKNTKHIKINNPKNDVYFYGALQQKISLMKVFWA